MAKRRPQVVEGHHDDCGEDFSPLGDDYFSDVFVDIEDEDYLYLNEDTDDYVSVDWHLGMSGSDFTPEGWSCLSESGAPLVFENVEPFARWDNSSYVPKGSVDDVAQLCGGAGDTGALLVKRGYRGGPNFDVIVGIDFSDHRSDQPCCSI